MNIQYEINRRISADEFIDILHRSTLGERRPVDDNDTITGMVENTNLIITAWHEDQLIGVSRAMTDFHYACYLSDLAVDQAYQGNGVGRKLIQITSEQLKEKCKLLLISAPDANAYYPKLGFEKNERTWVLPPGKRINS